MALRVATAPQWIDAVLSNTDKFLMSHAHVQRKSSNRMLVLMQRHSSKAALIETLLELSVQSLSCYQRLVILLLGREVSLQPEERNPYTLTLGSNLRQHPDHEFLDQLLIMSMVHERQAERSGMMAKAFLEEPIRNLYTQIAEHDAQCQAFFYSMACKYFSHELVTINHQRWLSFEGKLIQKLPVRPHIH
jgi:tRNA isopentenyl-2-thiomethyl-A-37 hydroxylase MiaE